MSRVVFVLCLLFTTQQGVAAECGSTANRAGCVGPNGAVGVGPKGAGSYNRNTGTVRRTYPHQVAPGTQVEGRYGNRATKGVEQGCGWVNGRRVCN
jgi:hypothetical protein